MSTTKSLISPIDIIPLSSGRARSSLAFVRLVISSINAETLSLLSNTESEMLSAMFTRDMFDAKFFAAVAMSSSMDLYLSNDAFVFTAFVEPASTALFHAFSVACIAVNISTVVPDDPIPMCKSKLLIAAFNACLRSYTWFSSRANSTSISLRL